MVSPGRGAQRWAQQPRQREGMGHSLGRCLIHGGTSRVQGPRTRCTVLCSKHTCVPGFHQAPRRPRVTKRPWVRGVESSPRLLGCAPQEGCPTDTCFQSAPSPLWACSCLWVGWEPSCPPGLFSTSMYEAWPGPWSPPSRAFLLCLSWLHPYLDLTAPQAGPPQSSSLRSPAGLPSESRLRTPCPSRVRGMPPAATVCSGGSA